jgi:hypothetical protein
MRKLIALAVVFLLGCYAGPAAHHVVVPGPDGCKVYDMRPGWIAKPPWPEPPPTPMPMP